MQAVLEKSQSSACGLGAPKQLLSLKLNPVIVLLHAKELATVAQMHLISHDQVVGGLGCLRQIVDWLALGLNKVTVGQGKCDVEGLCV